MADSFVKSAFFVVSLILCCHATLITMAGDSLKPGNTLNSTDQLCSAANKFCLQFGSFGGAFSYLLLYSLTDDNIWPRWVGNRNEPIVDNSGELSLDHSGQLKIVSHGKLIKVLYSPILPINNTKAMLLDNGNFVLQQLHPNGSTNTVLWQSFDYPTDMLLPGMKLGVNHKTDHNWSLVSWRAKLDPSSGDFRLEWEPIRRELILRQLGVIIWRSRLSNNNRSFENISDELNQRFTVVSNENEDYIKLTSSTSDENIPYWGLTYGGFLKDGKSVKYIKCYGFNNDDGCQLYDVPRCWQQADILNGHINFTDIQNVRNDSNSSLTRVDCQRSCWNDCDCVGYSTIYNNYTGCTFLFKHESVITVLHLNDDYRQIFMLKGPLHHPKGKRKGIRIGATIAASLIFTICLSTLCLILRKRKIQLEETIRQNPETTMLEFLQFKDGVEKEHDLIRFSYTSIIEATNGFSSENKLGEGGFGPVYKGIFPTKKEVAIKTLSKFSRQGVAEFTNELTLISELQHMNLVQILGYCIHEEERMLIYEFMPNKSLDFFLFDSIRSNLLDWQKRFNIIEGIAQGLLYLHKYSRLKVIHRDLKASNILLDESMNPKISDFGLARMFAQQESEANTLRIVGTYGYMSPEYAMEGVFSTKSDVYSFGVLLLEIISGRRNSNSHSGDDPLNLVAHAWKLWKEGAALQLMDPAIINSFVDTEVLRCIHIGILCVEENADDRPTMSNIISILTNKSAKLSLPKRPAFYTRTNIVEIRTSAKESNVNSINDVTLSELDAR